MTQQIGVLANAKSWYLQDLMRAAEPRAQRIIPLDFRGFSAGTDSLGPLVCDGVELTNADAVIVRTMPPGSLEQVVFRMDALLRLEMAGVYVLNSPKSIECAVDKYLATSRLEHAGLPVPQTIVCEDSESALGAYDRLGGDVVVKPLFGSEGRGIVRVSDLDIAWRTFRTLERLQSVLYLQRYIDHPGFDIRILVLDGRIVGAMRRSCADDFRTNISRRAVSEKYLPSDLECEFAIRAASATGAVFAGVDLLCNKQGELYVIEVNTVPGWRAFQRTTNIDVATLVLTFLKDRGAARMKSLTTKTDNLGNNG